MQDRFEKLYNYMLENGELKKVSRDFTGYWEQDRDSFIKAQIEMEKIADIEDES